MSVTDDPFFANLARLQFKGKIDEIFRLATARGWKVKLVIWKDSGEEWTLNPKGSQQTGEVPRPVDHVTATVIR